MTLTHKSNWIRLTCSLAVLTIVGCKSSQGDQSSRTGQTGQAQTASAVVFPQTSQPIVEDPAHPPQAGATVKETVDDGKYGKTERRSDDYIRHADAVSPTGWTPWHYRTAPHNWTEPMTYDSSVGGAWTAQVQAVDVPNRKITLHDSTGGCEEFGVDPRVERLNEVNVGDTLTVAWTATLHGELRPPTSDETARPFRYFPIVDRASSDAAPSAAAGLVMRVVTTVDAIDLKDMTVTLKGPLGNRIDVKAKSPENIKKLHVGDTIVATYSQGVAASVTKAP